MGDHLVPETPPPSRKDTKGIPGIAGRGGKIPLRGREAHEGLPEQEIFRVLVQSGLQKPSGLATLALVAEPLTHPEEGQGEMGILFDGFEEGGGRPIVLAVGEPEFRLGREQHGPCVRRP